MGRPSFRIEIDDRQARDFFLYTRRELEPIVERFLEAAGNQVAALQKSEAEQRLGVERNESHMQTVDPNRPKGLYMGSIRVQVFARKRAAEAGPNRVYAWWVERGHQAPGASPAQQKAAFRGHRIVERATLQAADPILRTLRRIVDDGLRDANRRAGGSG
jgi:hypothetical protein